MLVDLIKFDLNTSFGYVLYWYVLVLVCCCWQKKATKNTDTSFVQNSASEPSIRKNRNICYDTTKYRTLRPT